MFILYTLSAEELSNRDSAIEQYISAMANADASAMGGLYQLIKTDVYAYALSKLGKREDAEDITHDTFVQIYKNAPLYRSQGKPMAWIITIETNLIRRHYQSASRTVTLDESVSAESAQEDFTESVIDSEFIKALLRRLNEDEREVITLHVNSGLKHREIAKILKLPLSTVLSRYNRAIKKLQIIVKEGTK
ncbi:MAG: RNA polymerase sigma factor [Clostridia bacterium]|nr:RNA polymerase sigma factor [Clostridia bacterium]